MSELDITKWFLGLGLIINTALH